MKEQGKGGAKREHLDAEVPLLVNHRIQTHPEGNRRGENRSRGTWQIPDSLI